MKTCPVCHQSYSDEVEVCPRDRARLGVKGAPARFEPPVTTPTQRTSAFASSTPPAKSPEFQVISQQSGNIKAFLAGGWSSEKDDRDLASARTPASAAPAMGRPRSCEERRAGQEVEDQSGRDRQGEPQDTGADRGQDCRDDSDGRVGEGVVGGLATRRRRLRHSATSADGSSPPRRARMTIAKNATTGTPTSASRTSGDRAARSATPVSIESARSAAPAAW